MIAIFLQSPSLTLSFDATSSVEELQDMDCSEEPPLKGYYFFVRGIAND